MRFIYSLLFYLIMPFVFLRLLWRSRRIPDYRKGWLARLGFCPSIKGSCIWVHAVSVGESIAAIPLVKALQIEYPAMTFLITNMTPTGAARVKAAFGQSVVQTYVPYDLPDAVARFLDRAHPSLCIVMETELWPNLFSACGKRRIPIVIANARLSEKSFNRYRLVSQLTRDTLRFVTQIAAQSESDAKRFVALGAPLDCVSVLGNLKFDLTIPSDLSEKAKTLRLIWGNRPVWIAASTHEGEEEIILAAHKIVCEQIHNALLILVPRHPERFDKVAVLSEENGLLVARRTETDVCTPETRVYLGDTMGELLLLYAASDVVFVGGSFVPVGGHNLLEPAALSKPIIMGPSVFNFSDSTTLMLNANAMLQVHTGSDLANAVIEWFANPVKCREIGERAERVLQANRGSLIKHLSIVREIILRNQAIKTSHL